MGTTTDRLLRRRTRARPDLADFEAFSSFYDDIAERVLVFLARRCLDSEVAADLTAETFAKAYASRHRYRGDSAAEAEAWVFRIARNLLADYARRGVAERDAIRQLGVEVPALSDEDHVRIDELAGTSAIRAAVAESFDRLSDEQRDAVQLRIVDEVPYPEVARRLDITEQAARARVSRGLRELAADLDRQQPVEGVTR